MAMAEVYRPESDDRLSPYPRAPPPSPEAQHRALGGIFEFPRDVLEGFGIDLRRRDFDFSDFDYDDDGCTSPLEDRTTVQRSSPKRAASSDTDDSDCEQPGSPLKRMCSAPSTMPNSFETRGFQPILMSSTSNSCGNGPLMQPVSTGEIKVSIPNFSELAACNLNSPKHRPTSHSHSTSPTLFPQQHSGPYSIPPRSNGSTTPTHQPTMQPHDSSHLLSKSFDLHNVQSHFPAHFEATPFVPEVRPIRSQTLGATSYAQESPNFRTRKVSLKRNYGELESDPSLQFHFDYSYSSTGSSGDSDWVVIDNDLSSYPQGKKACCQQEPLSSMAAAAMSTRRSTSHTADSSPLHVTGSVSTSFKTGNGLTNGENLLPSSQDLSLTLAGQSSSSPLGVMATNNGADISVYPGGSAVSNGSGSHSPLHAHLGMIHGGLAHGSIAEVHSASSAAAGYGLPSTAEAALAERSQRAELAPQWSMEMMDCGGVGGDYGARLNSIDSMDCGLTSEPSVTMQSLGEVAGGGDEHLDSSPLFSTNRQTFNSQQVYHSPSVGVHNVPPNSHQPFGHGHQAVGMATRSQNPFGAVSLGPGPHAAGTTTRHSFIENYFVSYHNSPSAVADNGVVPADTDANENSRSNVSRSL